MVYDDAGRDLPADDIGNAKYLELNFRRRNVNELGNDNTNGKNNDFSTSKKVYFCIFLINYLIHNFIHLKIFK